MFARLANGLRSQCGARFIRPTGSVQTRRMGGGGAFMETSKFGENLGEFFGTVAWLWIFHRFNQDGAVLLGYQHPWEHGHEHGDHGNDHPSEKLTLEEIIAKWDIFSERSTVPGDDDDDDDEQEDDDDADDDDE